MRTDDRSPASVWRRAFSLSLVLTLAASHHLRADGRARLSGIVVDAKSATPIAHATVRIVPQAEGGGIDLGNHRSFEAKGGADGRFEFTDLVSGTYLVAVRAEGRPLSYGPAVALEGGAWRKDLRLSVERGASLQGVVLTRDGAPIAEASVVARPPTPQMWTGAPMGDEPVVVASTDAAGHFTLQGLSSVYVNVSASRLGFASRSLGGVPVSSSPPLELRLHRAGGLQGEVYRRGSPVAEVGVTALGVTNAMGMTATTSDTGSFAMRGLPPGRVNVRIGGWPTNGSEFVEFQEFVIPEGEVRTVRIHLAPGEGWMGILRQAYRELVTPSAAEGAGAPSTEGPRLVTGVVTMPDGSPAFPATLRFTGGRACTDTSGRFSFTCRRERIDVMAWMSGWAPDMRKDVGVGAGAPPLQMALGPQALLRVHVRRGKEALAGARVVVDGIPVFGATPEDNDLQSDADGVLFLDSLPPGERSVSGFSGGEKWEKRVTLVAGAIASLTLGPE